MAYDHPEWKQAFMNPDEQQQHISKGVPTDPNLLSGIKNQEKYMNHSYQDIQEKIQKNQKDKSKDTLLEHERMLQQYKIAKMDEVFTGVNPLAAVKALQEEPYSNPLKRRHQEMANQSSNSDPNSKKKKKKTRVISCTIELSDDEEEQQAKKRAKMMQEQQHA